MLFLLDRDWPTKILASFNAFRSGILNLSIGVGTVIMKISESIREFFSEVNLILSNVFKSFWENWSV